MAISPVPIIAVILMLFSAKARVNGPMFLAGWALALTVVVALAYVLAGAAATATEETTTDTIAWGRLILGVLLLLLAGRQWQSRPAPGATPPMPKWMAGIDGFTPGKAFGLALILAGPNPKNLLLIHRCRHGPRGAGADDQRGGRVDGRLRPDRQQHHPGAGRVLPRGGRRGEATLDSLKDWLAVNNTAVMAVLFLLFGVKLIADALPGLGG